MKISKFLKLSLRRYEFLNFGYLRSYNLIWVGLVCGGGPKIFLRRFYIKTNILCEFQHNRWKYGFHHLMRRGSLAQKLSSCSKNVFWGLPFFSFITLFIVPKKKKRYFLPFFEFVRIIVEQIFTKFKIKFSCTLLNRIIDFFIRSAF